MKKDNMLKQDSLLIKMAYLGQVYKKDFVTLMYDKGINYSSKMARALLDKGYIVEREVSKRGDYTSGAKTSVYAITHKGRIYLANKYNDDIYVSIAKRINKPFNTIDQEKLVRSLNSNRILTSIISAGVNALPPDKPSLAHLFAIANDSPAPTNDHIYNNSLTFDDIKDDGVYYTIAEFQEFIDSLGAQGESDAFRATRVKGIFLNAHQIIFCYIANTSRNKRLRLMHAEEKRFYNRVVQTLSTINDVNDIDALVISSGDSLISQMTIKKSDHDKTSNYRMLDSTTSQFKHLYVFHHNQNGADQMNFLFTHDFAMYKAYALDLFASLDFIKPIEGKLGVEYLFARSTINNRRIMFMPYIDVKVLSTLSSFHEEVDIITLPSMAKGIYEAIRRDINIYDLDGNRFDFKLDDIKVPIKKERVKRLRQTSVFLNANTKAILKKYAAFNNTTLSSIVREIANEIAVDKEEELNKAIAKDLKARKQTKGKYDR